MGLLHKIQKRVSMQDIGLVCNQLYHTNKNYGLLFNQLYHTNQKLGFCMKPTVSCKSEIRVYYSANCITHNAYIKSWYKPVVKELSCPLRLLHTIQEIVIMQDKG